jgi:hypothetical protein
MNKIDNLMNFFKLNLIRNINSRLLLSIIQKINLDGQGHDLQSDEHLREHFYLKTTPF